MNYLKFSFLVIFIGVLSHYSNAQFSGNSLNGLSYRFGNTVIGSNINSSPNSILEVRKDQNAPTELSIQNHSTGVDQEARIRLLSGNVAGVDMYSYGTGNTGTFGSITKQKSVFLRTHSVKSADKFVIGTGSYSPLQFMTQDHIRMSILPNGQFGFGTMTPSSFVEVRKDQNAPTELSIQNHSTGVDQEARIRLLSGNVAGVDLYSYGTGNTGTFGSITKQKSVFLRTHSVKSADKFVIGTGSYSPLQFMTQDHIRMSIQADGKVSIGNITTPNNYKLYVESGILTEKVKIALATSSDWADYIFQEDYQLSSLHQKETFIKQYGHLPNFQSATTYYKEGGIELKDITIKQQEVLEENTLYLIQHQKEIETLQEENTALKQEVEVLQAELDAIKKYLGIKK